MTERTPLQSSRLRIAVLGYIVRGPLGGLAWHYLNYVLGLSKLGHEVFFIEQGDDYPSCYDPDRHKFGIDPTYGLTFAADAFRRLGLPDCWTYHDPHTGRWHGPQSDRVIALGAGADLCLNISGITALPSFLQQVPVRAFIDTDPAFTQIRHLTDDDARRRAAQHNAFFTFAGNLPEGRATLPDDGFPWQATRQPVVLDAWPVCPPAPAGKYRSVMLWDSYDAQEYRGERYGQKSESFGPFLDLPQRAGRIFELAVGSPSSPGSHLEEKGWDVVDPLMPTRDPWTYQQYIRESKAEFGIAKHGYVVSRSGWFSERSACYLATGRPAILQDTGFSAWLPSGDGVVPFTTPDEAMAALDDVNSRYDHHCAAARAIAESYFDSRRVLGALIDAAMNAPARFTNESSARAEQRAAVMTRSHGVERRGPDRRPDPAPFPTSLLLTALSRRPTTLPANTVADITTADVPVSLAEIARQNLPAAPRRVSIVVATLDNLIFLQFCLTSILANTRGPGYEVIVVDNGSTDGSADYLAALARRHACVRVIRNERNHGFARATNQGLEAATGDILILLNDDTVVPRGWLEALCRHLDDATVGLVGPVTNRAGNDCQIPSSYTTYGEFDRVARERMTTHARDGRDVTMLTMFCLAMRRDTLTRIGPLDEQFEIGMFEDDDYAMRARAAGLRVVCAEDVFIHHFGATSLGKLAATGELGAVFDANRRRFEEKWGITWVSRRCRVSPEYEQLVDRIRSEVSRHVPPASRVAVISRGDDDLLDLPGLTGAHFPQASDGQYAGHHPADSAEAIDELETACDRGAEYLLVPDTMRWWLEFYREFDAHLRERHRLVTDERSFVLFALEPRDQHAVAASAGAVLGDRSLAGGA